MRYLNWDVLLFPGSSRIPLQEFDTKCHVLPDQSNRINDSIAFSGDAYLSYVESTPQIPILTSFIASLESGAPFRVSVHSWEPPKASQALRTFKTEDESIAFEARIYIDGSMVAQRIFDNKAIWPEVIEAASIDMKTTDHPKPIRFPLFHSEILDQAHWEPAEAFGRIRVVIAEGVIGRDLGNKMPPFDRLRDIIWFSFQHAPKHVLEYSAIAWPNARLFQRTTRSRTDTISYRARSISDFEAHAHSPQRRQDHDSSSTLLGSSVQAFPAPSYLPKEFGFEDPFIGPTPISLRQNRSQMRTSSNDVSMGDFNSIRTARSHTGTDMSGLSYQKPDFERALNQAAIEEIVQSLSPERKRDLFAALSPNKTPIAHGGRVSSQDRSTAMCTNQETCEQRDTLDSSRVQTRLAEGHRTSTARKGLLSSRFASAPSLTGTSRDTEGQGYSHGLRSSIDPTLSTRWKQTGMCLDYTDLEPLRLSAELRLRSSPAAPKRKRGISPSLDTHADSSKTLSMSTSPCKHDPVTPNEINTSSPAQGLVGEVHKNKHE